MAANKRRSDRIDFNDLVQVYSLPPTPQGGFLRSKKSPHILKGMNISKDGICLENLHPIVLNGIYQLDFQFFNNKTIHTFAKVVWSKKTSCGLQFMRPEEVLDLQWGLEPMEGAGLSNHCQPSIILERVGLPFLDINGRAISV